MKKKMLLFPAVLDSLIGAENDDVGNPSSSIVLLTAQINKLTSRGGGEKLLVEKVQK